VTGPGGNHWVRLATACNSDCLFCLDSKTPRDRYVPLDEVVADLEEGRARGAHKVVLSGGEGTLHPDYLEILRTARSLGYARIQAITNGSRLAGLRFYERCVEAGLGEITFSLHGHVAEVHDGLTRTPGSFERIVTALRRAARDPRLVCNVDVVINRRNVGALDRIVELAASLGVREFDLLHLIPQGAAFEHHDELFYDPAEHADVLRRVFRLARHPDFTIWTNRFPVAHLEGLEELIQDPAKLLDEVRGRRLQLRRYLDDGEPLDCRQPERCVHCFVEPFCSTVDGHLDRLHGQRWQTWDVGADPGPWPAPLPFGCTRLGVTRSSMDELPEGLPLRARVDRVSEPPRDRDLVLVVDRPDQLDAWIDAPGVQLDVELGRETAEWLLRHRDRVAERLDVLRLDQPGRTDLDEARARDVRDPASLFLALDLPIRTSGLAPCQTPGARLVEPRRILRADGFDADGRPDLDGLARLHLREAWRVKSLRCGRCAARDRCEGIPIQMVRDQGLRLARPLVGGAWPEEAARQLRALRPHPAPGLADGRAPLPPVPPLPGGE
jgi:MoaA/NifB/PqqE/SkfB family radical SAM enzyme